jgi:hypothetical protein
MAGSSLHIKLHIMILFKRFACGIKGTQEKDIESQQVSLVSSKKMSDLNKNGNIQWW